MEDKIEELLPFYVLGTLTVDEREHFEAYLQTNPEAREWVKQMTLVTTALPRYADRVDASPHVKKVLMERVQEHSRAKQLPAEKLGFIERLRRLFVPKGGNMVLPAMVVLSLVIAIASLAWALLMVNRASALNQEITNLQEKLASQEQLINNLQEQLVNEQQVIALISAPGTETFDITGTDLQPQARGRLFVKPNSQTGSLVLSGLTPLETGSVYQLWLIQGDLPVAAGVFTVDAQGQATLQLQAVQAISSYDALGVSVEPEGGSQQPTGDIVIFSALSKDA